MQKLLTPALLQFIIGLGYRYCLSRTTSILGEDADVYIVLKPIKQKPLLKTLPDNYDTYFSITGEPQQMAEGIDETIVLVDMTGLTQEYPVEAYFSS
jgi:hypothetical protein